ncbi:hypothetical protein ACFQL4_19750 [Halosimplex aquaticum]
MKTVKRSDDPGERAGDSIDEFVPARPDESSRDGPADDDAAGEVRSDGGTVGSESPFETTSSIQETRGDRIKRFFDEFVRTPWSILRGDWRALVGFTIVSIYVLVGTVGVSLVETTSPADGPKLVGAFQNGEFPLGTTSAGKDILSLTVHSTPSILIMMASGAVFTVVVGTAFGVVTGYKGASSTPCSARSPTCSSTSPGSPS